MEKITFTRQQLYDLVWSTPMSTLAKQYQISDNGLRKICKKLNIPMPYLGYWQKLQYGKEVWKEELPANYTGKDVVVLNETDAESIKKGKESSIKSRLIKEIESDRMLPLKVPSRLTNP
ncbi:MAG TPA: hypothetical protein VJ954_03000, partial [Ignavibacteriaceae bacterium]|nr:hypothetical protein [Ignavibacteriaceae bacterium]